MTAGYSGTPQAKKLGLKPGQRLSLENAPDGWTLDRSPDAITSVVAPEPADVIVSFIRSASELPEQLPDLAARIHPAGALWIAWPRRAGGHRSDVTENGIRDIALPLGIVDVKVAALDDDWSALKLVWRVENRAVAPKT
jgi:hypothetical protein